MLNYESHFVKVNDKHTLHLKRIFTDPDAPAVFLIHGSIENGKIFYTEKGKGLAPYLAENGFDCYIPDLRGRGESTPRIDRSHTHGQSTSINEDIGHFINKIKELKGRGDAHWIGHSWGGTLMQSHMVRYPETPVISFIGFGTKRKVTVRSWERTKMLDFGWNILSGTAVKIFGYLPAVQLKLGADNETRQLFKDINQWFLPDSHWVDTMDGFNYLEAAKAVTLPSIVQITAAGDRVLGARKDIQLFMDEVNAPDQTMWYLSKENGNLHDYDHINILTHKDCVNDHFPKIVDWLKMHS